MAKKKDYNLYSAPKIKYGCTNCFRTIRTDNYGFLCAECEAIYCDHCMNNMKECCKKLHDWEEGANGIRVIEI